MDIKNVLRKALLEGKHKNHKNKYGCVMIYLDADKKKWSELMEMIDATKKVDNSDSKKDNNENKKQ